MRTPQALDARSIQLQFDRRANSDGAQFLLREIESRMLERLELIKIEPAQVLDLGCGAGQGFGPLRQRFPQARLLGVDASPAMVVAANARLQALEPNRQNRQNRPNDALAQALLPQWMRALIGRTTSVRTTLGRTSSAGDATASSQPVQVGMAENLPLPDSSVDMVWSNMAMHWFSDPVAAIAQCKRVLRPQGLLMVSCFGVDTAEQLRVLGVTLPSFQDMHDLGDALVTAGFADPVVDMEKLTLTYQTGRALLADIRALGGNALQDRARGLHTPRQRQRWICQLEAIGQLTIEVNYLHAWLPARAKLAPGYSPIEFKTRPKVQDR